MPPHRLHEPVEVLLQLPGQAALADASLSCDRDEAHAPLAPRGVEELLEQPELHVPSHEGGLQAVTAASATPLAHDAERPPHRDGGGLALQVVLAGGLEDH